MCQLTCFWLISYYLTLSKIFAIEINYVKVPNAVKNNTNRPAILDCNYSIRPDDTELVVQWFLNEDLVYQWIPPNKPQSIGKLKGKVDLSYEATDDATTVYRALKIKNPTTDIAGEFKCLVSTMGDHDSRMKNMIVFEPEKQMTIRKTADEKYVNFTCLATDVYPSPKLLLYKDVKNNVHSRMRLSITEWDLKQNQETQKYTMFITGTAKISELDPGILINCELKIPGTGYVKLKSLLYYPEMHKIGNGCQRRLIISTNLIINVFVILQLLYAIKI